MSNRYLRELEEREKQAKAENEQLRHKLQETTLDEYLHDCHNYIFKRLKIADEKISATGYATKVDGKRYPMWLRRWSDFADIHRNNFDTINEVFGDKRLFPPSIVTIDKTDDACPYPAANENNIRIFEKIAIERPIRRILEKLLEVEPRLREEFNFTALQFSNNNRELMWQGKTCQTGDSDRSEESTYPDGLGLRKHPGGGESLAFVFGYMAAHKLKVEDLKPALAKEELFIETIQQNNGDKVEDNRVKANKQIAMALTQVFDHMIECGVAYGYVTAGEVLVFLNVRQNDLRTLYYHLCVPGEDAVDEMEASRYVIPQ